MLLETLTVNMQTEKSNMDHDTIELNRIDL